MSWKRLDRDALTAPLNARELNAYAQAGSPNGNESVEEILANTANLVRGYVRSAGLVRLDPDESAVPRALFGAALNYARFDYLTRFRLPVTDDRRKARDEAVALFELVREGKFKVEPGVEEPSDADSFRAASPVSLPASPRRLLD